MEKKPRSISLFIPCLVDQIYPEMGMAMVRVLESLGFELDYREKQTCCGQPAFNAGHHSEARKVACAFLDAFRDAPTIVGPSGSCISMIRNYYPVIFKGHPREQEATELGSRVFEFSEFLCKKEADRQITGKFSGRIGFHNSCHSLRELGIEDQPLRLLERIEGCEVAVPPGEPICCGFGGLFSVKYEPIASAMAQSRLQQFIQLGVETLVVNDPGCIMHMRQEAADKNYRIRIYHLVEFLDEAMKQAQPAINGH